MRNRSPQSSASALLGFCLWFVAALWACPAVLAAPTVLDFEDLAPGTEVTTQYGARGVVFLNHYLGTDPAAHSGTHVLRTVNPASEIFEPVPLAMTFNAPQVLVKFFAESQNVPLNGTLTAFDAAGNVVAQDGPKLVAANVFPDYPVDTSAARRSQLRYGPFRPQRTAPERCTTVTQAHDHRRGSRRPLGPELDA